ncbi:MAG: SpoIIE family protein phosphatase [Bacteroidales bacterium]|nr:SpoIIE family protein phosphatase [Bacteroidales bacterium]
MKRFFIILFLFVTQISFAQNFGETRGVPFVKNFNSAEYNGHEQNFDIIQDKSGLMYFANFQAVLIYDGARWVKVPTSSGMRVLSLDLCTKGIVYVGGLYDFGYITKDEFGQYVFVSLVDSSMTEEQVGEVFNVHCLNGKTYFITENKMFTYDSLSVEEVDFDGVLLESFAVNGELFLFFERDLQNEDFSQNGLTVYRNNSIIRLSDNSLEQIVDIKAMFYLDNAQMYVVGTESQGFFSLQNDIITTMEVSVNEYVRKNSITSGAKIYDDLYAIGTLTQGVLLVNNMGKIVQVVNKKSSLFDESINAVFVDESKNIWVATNNGISLIETNNPLSIIDNQISGIDGKINRILIFKGVLYVASDNGLFYFNNNLFNKISGLNVACWDMVTVDQKLVIATPLGIYLFDGISVIQTGVTEFSFCLEKSKLNSDLFYAGHNSFVTVLQIEKNNVVVVDRIDGFSGNATKIKEIENGDLYIEVPPGNIFKLKNNSNNVEKLITGQGFISLHINTSNNDVFFSSEKGLFQDNDKDTLQKFDFFNDTKQGSKLWMYDFFFINENTFLFTDGSRKNISLIKKQEDSIAISQSDFLPISDFTVRTFYFDSNNKNIWFGGNNGIIMSDFGGKYEHHTDFKVTLTKIISLNKDTLLSINNQFRKLQYSDNSIRIEFAAPYFHAKGDVLYSYYLDGFDNGFSLWESQAYKEYTNLPANNYVFYVKAKDQFGNEIDQAVYEFKILLPVYRRWWAIIIYIVVIGVLLKLFIDWRMKQADKEKEKLEEIIKERTAEIEKSKAEIEAQRDIEYKQRKEIMDSIHYAKRIQQAVLPSTELLQETLGNNYFVVFRPYEVVSGDYFWLKQLKNFIIIVAADCTGHGVPGAFMSMLGTSFLNEIVTRRSLDGPGTVLERLRNKVKSSLHQDGKQNEQKDGMDIALYFIDTETYELQFSGAYNSLYIVRETSKITEELKQYPEDSKQVRLFTEDEGDANYTLIELRANRQPIGIYIKEVPFNNTSLKLEKGDCIYSFSDGYQDQFGGDTGEKLNARRFRKLLMNVQGKDMAEQKRIIEQYFIKWKGDHNQVDDVLVFGLKVDF